MPNQARNTDKKKTQKIKPRQTSNVRHRRTVPSKPDNLHAERFKFFDVGEPIADHTEDRQKIAVLVTRLFDRWGLPTSDQLELLGLSPTSRAMLGKYRKGAALPATRDMLDRVGWLMAIHKSLRILYPQNPEICYSWVKRRNQLMGNLTPLEVMKEQGIIGLYRVTRFLDYLREH